MTGLHTNEAEGPLAIVCGGGVLPFAVADAVVARGRKVVLFPIKGVADTGRVNGYPHHWLEIMRSRSLIATLRKEGCRDVVLIGSLVRPSLWKIRMDWQTLLMLPAVVSAMRGGDNHLLSSIASIAERYGFRIVAAHDVAPEIIMAEGVLTRRRPDGADLADIARGLEALKAIGPFDIGQGAVVASQHVLAVEGIEGTDAMLARIGELRRAGKVAAPAGTGVLVKAPKLGQDRRLDMPTIGPRTIESAHAAGLGGIAVIAGETLVAEPEKLAAAANDAGIFVTGVKALDQ